MGNPRDIILADRLRQIRRKLDLTQAGAFEILGFNQLQDYIQLENGQKHFTPEIIEIIVSKFNITHDKLVGEKEREEDTAQLNLPTSFAEVKKDAAEITDLCNRIHAVRRELELSEQTIKIAELKLQLHSLKDVLMYLLTSTPTRS